MRKLKNILILIVLLAILFITANVTHVLTFYIIKDNALSPSYKNGHFLITSKLKNYAYNSLVCFTLPTGNKRNVHIRRVFGLEGDTIEINDGYALRNGMIVDNIYNVMFNYYVNVSKVRDFNFFRNLRIKPGLRNDSIILNLDFAEYNDIGRNVLLHKTNKRLTFDEPRVFGRTEKNGWDADHYGPVVVPKGCCFVLADNRGNFNDSRFWGCIPLANIQGTVF